MKEFIEEILIPFIPWIVFVFFSLGINILIQRFVEKFIVLGKEKKSELLWLIRLIMGLLTGWFLFLQSWRFLRRLLLQISHDILNSM